LQVHFVAETRLPKAAHLSDTKPVIEIRDLHKSYGDLEVLKGVSLTAPRGHVISLIGSSGSGKSTLLRCVNLLENSQSGEVLFEGEPVAWRGSGPGRHPADKKQVARIRTNLSMVFQQFNLWSHMTILQNVMEAPVTVLKRDRDEVEAKAREYLAKVGIGDKCDVWPAQLSGGQQQRVAIARALCMEPRALLFDEPTSALDPVIELMIDDGIRRRGCSCLIIAHRLSTIRDADQIMVVDGGRIVDQGSHDELYARDGIYRRLLDGE